ncbi:hypothetical protein AVEN_207737-1 [Araneus ventricosus]|uniref:Uncharacterized protein n=1 Tax=Araneus ventricosus TaxID=182803 RepID=A0A4Y2J604_ARAVE|nr:hypothetical protein AVEN_207737-1 [Araneus ventricosus]
MDLFIELKNECTSFRQDIYSKVDGFPKLMSPAIDNNQSDEPLPPIAISLQNEIFEAELKSEEFKRTRLWLSLPQLYLNWYAKC